VLQTVISPLLSLVEIPAGRGKLDGRPANERRPRVIVQLVKYKTGLSDEEAAKTIAERAPQYEALPGLRQKLYIREQGTGEYGGIYVWEDEDSMREFRQSDLAASIPDAYRVEGEPRVEIFNVVSILRVEEGVAPTTSSPSGH
jgi:heme-degrading monooxygenase HmoA